MLHKKSHKHWQNETCIQKAQIYLYYLFCTYFVFLMVIEKENLPKMFSKFIFLFKFLAEPTKPPQHNLHPYQEYTNFCIQLQILCPQIHTNCEMFTNLYFTPIKNFEKLCSSSKILHQWNNFTHSSIVRITTFLCSN